MRLKRMEGEITFSLQIKSMTKRPCGLCMKAGSPRRRVNYVHATGPESGNQGIQHVARTRDAKTRDASSMQPCGAIRSGEPSFWPFQRHQTARGPCRSMSAASVLPVTSGIPPLAACSPK